MKGLAPAQEWELIKPEGTIAEIELAKLTPRLTTLEGKKVGFLWNGKHNGDFFMERIEELLHERVKDIETVRIWEAVPGSNRIGLRESDHQAIKELDFDLVIGSSAD